MSDILYRTPKSVFVIAIIFSLRLATALVCLIALYILRNHNPIIIQIFLPYVITSTLILLFLKIKRKIGFYIFLAADFLLTIYGQQITAIFILLIAIGFSFTKSARKYFARD
jgi:hypothetical protein